MAILILISHIAMSMIKGMLLTLKMFHICNAVITLVQ